MLDTGILLFGNSGAGINSDLDSYHGQIRFRTGPNPDPETGSKLNPTAFYLL